MAEYSIIDVDTHISEVPDLWTRRVPAHMRDAVPRVETDGGVGSGGGWEVNA